MNWQPSCLKTMEVVLSNTYQIVTSACFSGAGKKSKGIEENIKRKKKVVLYLKKWQNLNVFHLSKN